MRFHDFQLKEDVLKSYESFGYVCAIYGCLYPGKSLKFFNSSYSKVKSLRVVRELIN